MPESEQPESTPEVQAPPIGVKIKRRAIMVEGRLVEMPEKDQIKVIPEAVPES